MDARAANDRVAEKAERFRFLSRVPMLCECSDPDCRSLVLISLPEYRQIRRDPGNLLTAPGHDTTRTELRREGSGYQIRHPRDRRERDGRRRTA